jgi:hypothetical protein
MPRRRNTMLNLLAVHATAAAPGGTAEDGVEVIASPQLVPQLSSKLVVLRCDRQAEAIRNCRQAVTAAAGLRLSSAAAASAAAAGEGVTLRRRGGGAQHRVPPPVPAKFR